MSESTNADIEIKIERRDSTGEVIETTVISPDGTEYTEFAEGN